MEGMIEAYGVCPKCGKGRMSPEAQHRPKLAGVSHAPGEMVYHCYNFANHEPGCGFTADMPTAEERRAKEAMVAAEVAERVKFASEGKANADAEHAAALARLKVDYDVEGEAARVRAEQNAEASRIATGGNPSPPLFEPVTPVVYSEPVTVEPTIAPPPPYAPEPVVYPEPA